ncbi:MAG: hypothetical protein A2Y10_16530 [Planctomycetes bacterium GWF2_41_51]|nr:MAG: hypothetical protein A2Y10_16530 [Planctomycetes bacterium GWF2_41_51]HBG27927.1 hypothetical protein [Phycisphaerales bacterium]
MKQDNWILEPGKYLNKEEAEKLLDIAKTRAKLAEAKNGKIAIRDYFLIHLVLATGLRVMEIAALNCGDIFLDQQTSYLIVRKGKGGKRRIVFFNETLREHFKDYFKWKQSVGQSIEPDQPLFMSSHSGKHMARRSIQKAFKRCASDAGLPERYSIHAARHFYACVLLKASNWNLRLVQRQLGHSRLTTTQVYADVMMPDVKNALEKLCF